MDSHDDKYCYVAIHVQKTFREYQLSYAILGTDTDNGDTSTGTNVTLSFSWYQNYFIFYIEICF